MCSAQFAAAVSVCWMLVGACGGSGIKASGGSGGAAQAGVGGVPGVGGLSSNGPLAAGGMTGLVGTGGTSGGGATITMSGDGGGASGDASAGRDAPIAPDSQMITCRPAPPCPPDWNYVYNDSMCGFGGTVSRCVQKGDGLCYQECTTNSDCTNPNFSTCGSLQLANGSDYFSSTKRICAGSPSCGDGGT